MAASSSWPGIVIKNIHGKDGKPKDGHFANLSSTPDNKLSCVSIPAMSNVKSRQD